MPFFNERFYGSGQEVTAYRKPRPRKPRVRKPIFKSYEESGISSADQGLGEQEIVGKEEVFNFSSGGFWQTELGEKVRGFSDVFIRRERQLSPSDIAAILKLRQGSSSAYLVANLAKSGILADVEADEESGRFSFQPAHAVVAGLAFLHLERGYDFEELPELLDQLLSGTELSQFVGEINAFHYPARDKKVFFAKDSRWRQFPLNPAEGRQGEDNSGNVKETFSLLGKCPRVEVDRLEEVRGWSDKKLAILYGEIPDNNRPFGDGSQKIGIPPDEVLEILGWLRAFGLKGLAGLRNYRRGAALNNREVREAIDFCLGDMKFTGEPDLMKIWMVNERRLWQEISDKREEQ